MLNVSLLFFIITINSFTLSIRRIIGGGYTDIRQFPHQVSFRYSTSDMHFCGGSILNQSFIITASHCLYDQDTKKLAETELFIVAGQTELTLHDKSIIRNVKMMTTHPRYDKSTFEHDVALVELKQKLPPFDETMQPISLYKKEVVGGLTCSVTGWGAVLYDKDKDLGIGTSERLKKADFKTVALKSCRKEFKKRSGYVLSGGTFCAQAQIGKNGRPADACQGDSGGPLTCDGQLVGIVSVGIGCGIREFPGIYTDVRAHLSWIQYQVDASSPKRFSNNYIYFLIAIAIKFTFY